MKNYKRLGVACVALAVALATSTTTTLAWFTENTNVAVSNVSGEVTSDVNDLFVAWGGFNALSTTVPSPDSFVYNLNLSRYLNPYTDKDGNEDNATGFDSWVTAQMGGSTLTKDEWIVANSATVVTEYPFYFFAWQDATSFSATKGVDFKSGNAMTAADLKPNVDYVEFVLWFKTTSAAMGKVTLDFAEKNGVIPCSATATHPTTVGKVPVWDKLQTAITAVKTVSPAEKQAALDALVDSGNLVTNASNALRISCTNYTGTTYATQGTPVVWEPNPEKGFALLGNGYNVSGGYWDFLVGNDASCATTATGTYAKENSDNLPTDNSTATICQLSSAAVQKVVVRIWLEGNDTDCLNTILGDKVNLALGFHYGLS